MSDKTAASGLKTKLPGIKPAKTVLRILEHAEDPLPAWVVDKRERYGLTEGRSPLKKTASPISKTTQMSGSTTNLNASALLLSKPGININALSKGGALPSTLDRRRSEWMGTGGRLRVGSSGVPVKFGIIHDAAVKLTATARERMAGAEGEGGSVTMVHREEPELAPLPASNSAAGLALPLSHSLISGIAMVAALVGEEALAEIMTSMGYEDMYRHYREQQRVVTSGRDDMPGTGRATKKAPLHHFDNEELEQIYELRMTPPPLECVINATGYAPFYVPHRWIWAPVLVTGFTGHSLTDLQLEVAYSTEGEALTKVIPRISVCFENEDRNLYAHRVLVALVDRERYKLSSRLARLLDKFPLPDLVDGAYAETLESILDRCGVRLKSDPPVPRQLRRRASSMTEATLSRAVTRQENFNALQKLDVPPKAGPLVQEVSSKYLHATRYAAVQHLLRMAQANGQSGVFSTGLADAYATIQETLRTNAVAIPLHTAVAPQYGKIAISERSLTFQEAFEATAHCQSVGESKIYQVYQTVMRDWMSEYRLLFAQGPFTISEPVELPWLTAKIAQYHKLLKQRIGTEWSRHVANTVVDATQDYKGHGTFDCLSMDLVYYAASDIRKVVQRVQAMMVTMLQQAIQDAARRIEGMLSRFVDAPPTSGSWQMPLLKVKLALKRHNAISQAAASVRVQISPPIHDVYLEFCNLLSAVDHAAAAVKRLDYQVMMLVPLPRANESLLRIQEEDPQMLQTDLVISKLKRYLKEQILTNLSAACNELADAYQKYAWVAALDAASVASSVIEQTNEQGMIVQAEELSGSRRPRIARRDSAAVLLQALSDQPASIRSLLSTPPSINYLQSLLAEATKYHAVASEVLLVSLDTVDCGMFRVSTESVRQHLSHHATKLCAALLEKIKEQLTQQVFTISGQYDNIINFLQKVPSDESELVDWRRCVQEARDFAPELTIAVAALPAYVENLKEVGYQLDQETMNRVWSLFNWPAQLEAACNAADNTTEAATQEMFEGLETMKMRYQNSLDGLFDYIQSFKRINMSSIDDLPLILRKVNDIDSELRSLVEQFEDINAREQCLGQPVSQSTLLEELVAEFEIYSKLWNSLGDFQSKLDAWLSTSILQLNATEIEQDVLEWWNLAYKLMKTIPESSPGALAGAKLLRQLTDSFKRNIPLIRCLASKALTERHWVQISEKSGKSLFPDDDEVTLQVLLNAGLLQIFDDIEEVTSTAEKEYALFRNIDAMKHEWSNTLIEVVPYKETGTYVIRGTDEVGQLLDDHIVKVQAMLASPYIRPHSKEASAWEKVLLNAQAVLDEWILLQRGWMYLEPIFSSEDILRQMPQEGRRFAIVDKQYRKHLSETVENPRVLDATGKDKLYDKLKESNKQLDQIQRGLNDYLEIKRLAFPRFFFLSNDELLEILAETKDPTKVQPHLGKCFEGIARVQFAGNGDEMTIVEMVSAENEQVALSKPILPNSPRNKGNVELWLTELQNGMRTTLRDVIASAIASYAKTPRDAWVTSWPGQVVLCVSQLYWTREVELALSQSGTQGLKTYLGTLNDQLQGIVQLVRSKLDKLQRSTLSALCVIDVHARDVVQEMVDNCVDHVSKFGWISQLRYYWERPASDPKKKEDLEFELLVRCINSTLPYGYEYLGNTSRLVITPLTDRCYRTLMGAVALQYGGAPAGPAGTGKTETTKDLSKAVAIQCVVFNCGEGLDYLAMAKFFKGLVAAGAWSCFDEFNRIDVEVLSVVAQQILTIQKAKKSGVKQFLFDGTTLPLNQNANVFITMNPGYAGRSELPENLKALFRPCAMMVPDYAMIAEIKLYSFGFADARNMARKLTQVLRLSSEQLSSQKHYDYGMRAVFSILMRAGALRQTVGDKWSEDMIVLQAIRDVNVPKFTTNDLPLFEGITSDLFLGLEAPKADYSTLHKALTSKAEAAGLQAKPGFIENCTQLYETVQVRHGLMLVGETMSGKSAVLDTLARAMTSLSGTADFVDVCIHRVNPKSINSGQLFGVFDENTHEWSDGVLAFKFRLCAGDQSNTRHWLMFDGPVDAVWIENMNTVLDDNKKLCLSSGAIIKMSPLMTIMFETDSLEQASPATVSRVGMIFMEPKRLGWRSLLLSWMKTLSVELMRTPRLAQLLSLSEWLLPPLLHFVLGKAKSLVPVTAMQLVSAFLRMLSMQLVPFFGSGDGTTPLPALESILYHMSNKVHLKSEDEDFIDFDDDDTKGSDAFDSATSDGKRHQSLPVQQMEASAVPPLIEGIFVQALTWTFGTVLDTASQEQFSEFLNLLLQGRADTHRVMADFMAKNPAYDAHLEGGGLNLMRVEGDTWALKQEGVPKKPSMSHKYIQPPPGKSVFDCCFAPTVSNASWVPWSDMVKRSDIPAGTPINNIVIATAESFRNSWFVDRLLQHGSHVLCVGDTGTGKSVTMQDRLSGLASDRFIPILLGFSAQTSSNATQDIVDAKMSRRRKGVFGPSLGQRAVVFIDDLNMPAKDTYGSQPPIELLRQCVDQGGWYDYRDKEKSFMEIVDTQFAAAMGLPGGGRTHISQRYLRRYNIIGFNPFSTESLTYIFQEITKVILQRYPAEFSGLAPSVAIASVTLFRNILETLLPTPAKSHYIFNLRDLSRVLVGLNLANPTKVSDPTAFMSLWGHEVRRVFEDRLVDDADSKWVRERIESLAKEAGYEIRADASFCCFTSEKTKDYLWAVDPKLMVETAQSYLADYNSAHGGHMNLVLSEYAVAHISRITRVLLQPQGNALLVGLGGSGRKSLAKLATHIVGSQLFSIEISKSYGIAEWKEDLKRVLKAAGKDGKQVVFMLSDTQLVKESFLEDINNLLDKGDIPSLFEADERAALVADMQSISKKLGRQIFNANDALAFFTSRVKSFLHLVLCMSPIGEDFRRRMRMFPSLVNCAQIDWFHPWPSEALLSVASHLLQVVDIPGSESVKAGVVELCVDMQLTATTLSQEMLHTLKRPYYVTPSSYLELISTFSSMLSRKRDDISKNLMRYENGIEKLVATEAQVAVMQAELTALQPQLKTASEETTLMIANIEVMSKDVGERAEVVAVEEKSCAERAAAAQAIKTDCETQLAEAIPILEGAIKAVAALSKSDIVEVKSLKSPPNGVKVTMEAVSILFGITPKKVKASDGKGKVDDYWEVAQKELLGNSHLVDDLKKYDVDNIPEAKIEKLKPYIERPDFEPSAVVNVSVAAGGLAKWCHAVYRYDKVAKVVAPKRAALAEATAELAEAEAALNAKRAALAELRANLDKLKADLNAAQEKKSKLAADVDVCAQRLERAQQLIGGLGVEKVRWAASVKCLTEAKDKLLGDILLASGQIAYLGPFPLEFRRRALKRWKDIIQVKKIPCSTDFSLSNCLGDPVKIRDWIAKKLPADDFSVDNAVMLHNSKRWPLCIDPQKQAHRWIRNMETTAGLKVVRQNQPTYLRTIENCVQFGTPVLIESVGETIDPVLDSLLMKQYIRSGSSFIVRLGDAQVEVHPNFKLYLSTVLPNPHYGPEICVSVNLLNFMATEDGLRDQMLALAVKLEKPELEEQREKLIVSEADLKRQLKELEDKVLSLLAAASGNILDDSVLIRTLSESKQTADVVQRQVEAAEKTQIKIQSARQGYQPIAKRASLLFFGVAELSRIDPMYQFSLQWYTRIFSLAAEKAPKHDAVDKRVKALLQSFTHLLYENVCRSLFESHKVVFSLLLAIKILLAEDKLVPEQVAWFLRGTTSTSPRLSKPTKKDGDGAAQELTWLTDKMWLDILEVLSLPKIRELENRTLHNMENMRRVIDAADPLMELEKAYTDFGFSSFAKICLIKCVRPDKLLAALQKWIEKELGAEFVERPSANLARCFEDSDNATPLIFILSAGADPMSELMKLAEGNAAQQVKLSSVSLGQGQGPVAEAMIAEAVQKGSWVCLQNCHLAPSWMSTLERIVEDLNPQTVHPGFRLWLTSMPSQQFPVSILQMGVKMTMELPKGVKAAMQAGYNSLDTTWIDAKEKPEFCKLVFGLCFFHAIVCERRRFGPQGWVIRYDFSESDLRISLAQLHQFLHAEDDTISFEALRYLTGECNYGGRVTDDLDRRLLSTMLADIYSPRMLVEGQVALSVTSSTYTVPPSQTFIAHKDAIKAWPLLDAPSAFGLHDNADITVALADARAVVQQLLMTLPNVSSHVESDSSSDKSTQQHTVDPLATAVEQLLGRLPNEFDVERVQVAYPVSYEQSLNSVLIQECIRYNGVISKLASTLSQLKRAIKGLLVMSSELERDAEALNQNRVPDSWKAVSYPSIKPLMSWYTDFLARLKFLQNWIDGGPPVSFWISGFYFTQSFLTGTRQNYARKHKIAIDELSMIQLVLPQNKCTEYTNGTLTAPEDGAYVHGMYLQGARWDASTGTLGESSPRQLFCELPVMHLLPCPASRVPKTEAVYECPIYKTSERAGTLSTTGHSTNLVMSIRLPIPRELPSSHWVKRGVALLCQLDD